MTFPTLKEFILLEEDSDLSLKAVMRALKFDGDIPLHNDGSQASKQLAAGRIHNQADKMQETKNGTLYYVSLTSREPDDKYEVEAYVVCDTKGKCSYYDFSNYVLVIDNKIVRKSPPGAVEDKIEEVVQEYNLEGNHPKPGALEAYLAALHSAAKE